MKIVVLGGGISTERHVSLVSGTSICKALRERGHKAIFVDMFFGLEDYEGSLEDAFDAPDGCCGSVAIETQAPDIKAVIASRKYKSPSRLGKNVLEICALADCVFLGLHGADGDFGAETEQALRQFQQKSGLSASGAADAETLAALRLLNG